MIEAFRSVDRGDFVPAEARRSAYGNAPLRVGNHHLPCSPCPGARTRVPERTSRSAPFIYGVALEALEIRHGQRFLNVGSGTGYFSTVVAAVLRALSAWSRATRSSSRVGRA